MKCPHCTEPSKVFSNGSSTTLLGYRPYYDEDGVYHDHNPNNITSYWRCSKGHRFETKGKKPFPNCDYGKIKQEDEN